MVAGVGDHCIQGYQVPWLWQRGGATRQLLLLPCYRVPHAPRTESPSHLGANPPHAAPTPQRRDLPVC